jgi:Ran GTPase-activating protein (RanGAP) involved in mRNA processing and transport
MFQSTTKYHSSDKCASRGMNLKFDELRRKLEKNDASTTAIIWHFPIDDTGIALLSESLAKNSIFTEIYLTKCEFGNEGFISLASLIEAKKRLKKLVIDFGDNNKVVHGTSGTIRFGLALRHCRLMKLEIKCMNMFDNSTSALASGLAGNNTIERVDIVRNYFGDDGVKEIAKMMRVNTSIKYIDLSQNMITCIGVQSLCSALQENTSLRELNLSCNPIEHDGIISISQMLHTNSTVEVISMQSIEIDTVGAAALVDAVSRNVMIRNIYLDDFEVEQQVRFYTELNTTWHRQILRQDDVPVGLWADIFARCGTETWDDDIYGFEPEEILYYFVKEKAELFLI